MPQPAKVLSGRGDVLQLPEAGDHELPAEIQTQ